MCVNSITRDEADILNEMACPLTFPTANEVGLLDGFMKITYPGRYNTPHLYHYTTPDVLEKFFEYDGDLRCTHARHDRVNDNDEWLKGVGYIHEYFLNRGDYDLAEEVALLPEKIGCAPYIFCFSQYEDKASMWGMYGDRRLGGYAVGFEKSKLEQLIQLKNKNSKDEYYLMPCLYTGIDSADKVLDYILDELHGDEDEHLFREGCNNELPSRILARIFFLSLIIKDGSFDYENEWRLIVRRHDAQPVGWQNINRCRLDKPYIYSELFTRPLREYFERIIVSPCGPNWVSKANYERLMRWRNAFNLNFCVEMSRSSYNGR